MTIHEQPNDDDGSVGASILGMCWHWCQKSRHVDSGHVLLQLHGREPLTADRR